MKEVRQISKYLVNLLTSASDFFYCANMVPLKSKTLSALAAGILSTALIASGSTAALAENVPSPKSTNQSSSAKEVSFSQNGHNYKVTFDEDSQTFISYYDGKVVNRVPKAEMEKLLTQNRSQQQYSANKCDVGMATAAVVNGALWTGAAIAAPESGGASLAAASFATSLIPTAGGLAAC